MPALHSSEPFLASLRPPPHHNPIHGKESTPRGHPGREPTEIERGRKREVGDRGWWAYLEKERTVEEEEGRKKCIDLEDTRDSGRSLRHDEESIAEVGRDGDGKNSVGDHFVDADPSAGVMGRGTGKGR